MPLLTGPALRERFEKISALLLEHSAIWRPRPMRRLPLPWEGEHAELAAYLRALPLAAIEQAEGQPFPVLDDAPLPFADWSRSCQELSVLGLFPGANREPGRRPSGIKARKWQQIQAFAETAGPALNGEGPLLDWCGGKAHLGRLLAGEQERPLILVERQAALCREAKSLAAVRGLNCEAVTADAFSSLSREALGRAGAAVALHACGALGAELLFRGAEAGLESMALAPCCHHRIQGQGFGPRSELGRKRLGPLALTRDDLRLATTEFVPGRPSTLSRRRRWLRWRIGFDLLARREAGAEECLPVPHFPPAWVKRPFREFCQALAARSGLSLPPVFDEARVLEEASERARLIRALALPRLLFRRPLELCVQLDRALALEERGYGVELACFCERGVTPRNLLLIASRA